MPHKTAVHTGKNKYRDNVDWFHSAFYFTILIHHYIPMCSWYVHVGVNMGVDSDNDIRYTYSYKVIFIED